MIHNNFHKFYFCYVKLVRIFVTLRKPFFLRKKQYLQPTHIMRTSFVNVNSLNLKLFCTFSFLWSRWKWSGWSLLNHVKYPYPTLWDESKHNIWWRFCNWMSCEDHLGPSPGPIGSTYLIWSKTTLFSPLKNWSNWRFKIFWFFKVT